MTFIFAFIFWQKRKTDNEYLLVWYGVMWRGALTRKNNRFNEIKMCARFFTTHTTHTLFLSHTHTLTASTVHAGTVFLALATFIRYLLKQVRGANREIDNRERLHTSQILYMHKR